MRETARIEQALLKTRKSLREVCRELDLDVPDKDELLIDTCAHCGVWNKNYKLIEDLDGNFICTYCENLVGLQGYCVLGVHNSSLDLCGCLCYNQFSFSKRLYRLIMDKDAYIKELEKQLIQAVSCLEDVATGKWGWAWEEVIEDARDLIERGNQA